MFSLIITIISIALTAALAIATVFYGGQIFADQSLKADASRIISQGQQVRAAFDLAKADGAAASEPTALVPTYLREVPTAPEGSWGNAPRPRFNMMASQPKSAKLCQRINEMAGVKASDTADTTDVDSALAPLMSADEGYLAAKFPFFCVRIAARYAVLVGTL